MGSPSLPAMITGMSAFILYTASTLTLRRSATFHAYHVALFWIAFALISASTLLGPVAEGAVDSPLRLFIAVTMPLLPAVHATWALAGSVGNVGVMALPVWHEEAVLDPELLPLSYADSIPSASSRLASIALRAVSLSSASLSGVGGRDGFLSFESSAILSSEK